MQGTELLSWYAVGFVATFAVGLVLLVVGMMGFDHDPSADTDTDADHPLLDLLGVGKCPLSLVLMTFAFLFTLFGLATVIVLRMFYAPGPIVGTIAYPVAFVGGLLFTRSIAKLIGKLMPTTETYVEAEASRVGTTAIAVYDFTEDVGFVQGRDTSGTVYEFKAVNSVPDKPIKAGDTVVVVDREQGTFLVQKAPEGL